MTMTDENRNELKRLIENDLDMCIEEYDSELPYDGDMSDDSQYCRHGTFIGSWWGPDYMCGQCEMGDDSDIQDEMVDHTPIVGNYLESDKPERFCPKCATLLTKGMLHFLCHTCPTYYKYDDSDIMWELAQSGHYCLFCGSPVYSDPDLGIMCESTQEPVMRIISH